ncbi:hypothetical protein AB0G15_23705 [Streptosporangium sp. NPDC023825]|uniref:hypothetical protein n=1 Tax=Streptosporangium sp. NPDC023825 TaxID=3154909 RepID=UPI003424F49E
MASPPRRNRLTQPFTSISRLTLPSPLSTASAPSQDRAPGGSLRSSRRARPTPCASKILGSRTSRSGS